MINNKYMKDYDKNKESPYLNYWDVKKCVWTNSLNIFKQVDETAQFNEDFIKSYNEDSDKEYFLKLMFNILKNYMTFTMMYHFT